LSGAEPPSSFARFVDTLTASIRAARTRPFSIATTPSIVAPPGVVT
jgi:hypothetical protein